MISSGFLTIRALEAAEALKAEGVSVAVLHVSTLRPLDAATILAEAGVSRRAIVVAENHSVFGGLGEAVAGGLMRNGVSNPFHQVGLPDE